MATSIESPVCGFLSEFSLVSYSAEKSNNNLGFKFSNWLSNSSGTDTLKYNSSISPNLYSPNNILSSLNNLPL